MGSRNLGNVVSSQPSSRQYTAPLSTSRCLLAYRLVVSVSRATNATNTRARRPCGMTPKEQGDGSIDPLHRPARNRSRNRGSAAGYLVALTVRFSDSLPPFAQNGVDGGIAPIGVGAIVRDGLLGGKSRGLIANHVRVQRDESDFSLGSHGGSSFRAGLIRAGPGRDA